MTGGFFTYKSSDGDFVSKKIKTDDNICLYLYIISTLGLP